EASMNVRELIKGIPENDLNKTKKETFSGLNWNHDKDTTRLLLKPWLNKKLTKNTILQFTVSQYSAGWNDSCWLDKNPSQWTNGELSYNAEDEITQAVMSNSAKAIVHNYEVDKIQFIEAHRFSKWTKQHERLYHGGIAHTLSAIRRRFWILKGSRNKTNDIFMHGLPAAEGKTFQIATNAKPTRITSTAIKNVRAASLDIPIKYENDEEEYTPYGLKTKDKIVKHWSNALRTLDVFWKLWRQDCLASLRKHSQKEIHSLSLTEKRLSQVNGFIGGT
ncbi:unnamed protein product, partial [Onchocerca ochengi]